MPSERRPSHVADLLLKGNLVCSPTPVQAFHFKLDQARRRCDPYLVFCLQAAVQHSDQMPSLSLSDRIAHLLGSTAFLRREEAPTLLLICPRLTLFLFLYFHHCMQTHGTFFLQLRRMMNSTRGDPTLACASDYPRGAGIKTSSSGVRWPGRTQAPPWGWLYRAGYAPRHLLGRTGGTPHQVHHRLNQKQTWILSSLLRRLSPTAARQGSDHVEHGNHIWLGGQLLLPHWTSLLHGSQGDGLHVPAWR